MIGESNAEVYERHANELVHFATGLVGPSDAADVVADAVMAAFRSPRWSEVEERRAYLYRCVLNTARNHQRSALARRARERKAATSGVVALNEPDVDVMRALERLSLRQRAVIVLTYWEDLTVGDAADRLGISEGSVRRHLARARARLREVLA